MAMLLLRGQSLAPAQLGLLNASFGAGEIAHMSVADFARMRLVVESLRFPLLILLKEAIAAGDAVTLTRLGFAGVVLASQGTAEQIGTQIQSLREALEQVPTPKGRRAMSGWAASRRVRARRAKNKRRATAVERATQWLDILRLLFSPSVSLKVMQDAQVGAV